MRLADQGDYHWRQSILLEFGQSWATIEAPSTFWGGVEYIMRGGEVKCESQF
jgi:hypothetical protein